MFPGFKGQMVTSVLIGALSSTLYPFLHSGKVNSIGLTVVMICIFLIGYWQGEKVSTIKNSDNDDKKKM
ncbi:hypothetical protein GAP32_410 [Cronobacter phage vB_CsaM_GAP32]|uniref:Putative membrane protein n=1 Tax=Cronobacter phage vB_CsaM_GAP32 TaxID=1141136 RepID=K4F750_9CAUD|nr:hypothetical protein GAP32_410 [Cronobacter phage vB_CsaM_GAP32]AFC21863.1 putative membrane protein [Cronobacter phage vB_CsaM_GAP32]